MRRRGVLFRSHHCRQTLMRVSSIFKVINELWTGLFFHFPMIHLHDCLRLCLSCDYDDDDKFLSLLAAIRGFTTTRLWKNLLSGFYFNTNKLQLWIQWTKYNYEVRLWNILILDGFSPSFKFTSDSEWAETTILVNVEE